MRREPCLLPVRRATKSSKESHSLLALSRCHFAPAVQGAACGIPHGWENIPNQEKADTAHSYIFPCLTFPHGLAGLRSLALFHQGFQVLILRGFASTSASLLHTQDLLPGMVGNNSITPLQQGAQILQIGHVAVSPADPYHPPQHLQNPTSKTEDNAAS